MDYVQVIETVIVVILGGVVAYLTKYTTITDKIAELITLAEETYRTWSKAGEQKMQFCIDQLNKIIPKALKPILSDEVLRLLIQGVFDQMKAYANIQKAKLADKINDKIENVDADKVAETVKEVLDTVVASAETTTEVVEADADNAEETEKTEG